MAIAAGLDFLRARQSPTGCWTDWDLPPGRSSMWTTAYVGCQLGGIALQSQAAAWLAEHELPGGGWGYDENVGCDADSSAYAIVLHARTGRAVRDRSCLRLESFQQPDGGFSTYGAADGLGSWGVSHPDVTPVAAHALVLARGRAHPAVAPAVDYVIRARNDDGLWRSFWWSTPLYATRASLAFLAETDTRIDLASTRAALLQLEPASAFERALLVDCLLLVGGAADELVDTLLSEQLADGSWPSLPSLRIPDRTCTAPWDGDAGVLYADLDRLFTTATVLGALSRATATSASSRSQRKDARGAGSASAEIAGRNRAGHRQVLSFVCATGL